jgi:hypothetical protein
MSIDWVIVSAFIDECISWHRCHDREKSHSTDTQVAGMARKLCAIGETTGKWTPNSYR